MLKLALLFLRLGVTSFGGPAAHIALMEEEFVHRRKWMSREKFLDLMAMTNLIPGPNSTEMAIHIGYLRAGWWGFWIAGICFILPAFALTTALAFIYVKSQNLPSAHEFMTGAKSVVFVVILLALERFFRSSFRIQKYQELFQPSFWQSKDNTVRVFILFSSLFLAFRDISEIAILLNCGVISLFILRRFFTSTKNELGSLFLIFLKIGSLLFGSGYVLLSFLESELIKKHALLTEGQLLDAISVGQFTPGPVFTTASFIGYLLEGFSGALVATLGIFLPAFFFVAVSIPLAKKMDSSQTLRSFIDGVVIGSVGLLVATLWRFGHSLEPSALSLTILVGSWLLLITTKTPSALLILAGGAMTLFL